MSMLWAGLILGVAICVLWLTYNGGRCSLYDCWYTYCDEIAYPTVIPTMITERHIQNIYGQLDTNRYPHKGKSRDRQCEICLSLLMSPSYVKIERECYHLECIQPIVMRYVIDRCIVLSSFLCRDVLHHIIGDLYALIFRHRKRKRKRDIKILFKC